MNELVIYFIILTVTTLMATLFIIWQDDKKPTMSLILKSVASFCFVALGIICAYLTHNYFLAIMFGNIGLVASAFGDVLLGYRDYGQTKDKLISTKMGFIAFAVAQVCYFVMLSVYGGFSIFSILIGLCIAVAIFFGEKLLKLNYGKLRYYVLGYSFVLASTLGQAIMSFVTTNFARASIMFLVGFVLFFASDLVLAFIYFKEQPKKYLTYVNYGLYYAAVILIAAALFLM